MPDEVMTAERRMAVPAAAIFDVLCDPRRHADIDGTGWVCDPLDTDRLCESGQRFRMSMHHEQLPEKDYEMTNEVIDFDEPHSIGWRPGQPDENGVVRFGGWTWAYELEPVDADTTLVTLTYDWSEASEQVRKAIPFPPFAPEHLDNSLAHLASLAGERPS